MGVAKITARYPHGVFNLSRLGVWQINERRYLWGFIPYWKVVEEIPQLDVDKCINMNLPLVCQRVKELGLILK